METPTVYNGKTYRAIQEFDAAGHGTDPDRHFKPGDPITSCECHMQPRIDGGLIEEVPAPGVKPPAKPE